MRIKTIFKDGSSVELIVYPELVEGKHTPPTFTWCFVLEAYGI